MNILYEGLPLEAKELSPAQAHFHVGSDISGKKSPDYMLRSFMLD